MASFRAALTLEVAAWVVAWILSCRLLLLSDSWRKDGEDGVEEDDGYLTGDPDPVIRSEGAMVVCPVEEREEGVDFPALEESVESAEVFREDKLEPLLRDESMAASAAPRAVLKVRLEGYTL